jgi:uncharacterized protein (TIGR02246 family)
MRTIAPVIALVITLIAPAFAQKAEIEAVNTKWIEFFNKGDFAGVASLYTDDAVAFPPGSAMVKGRAAIEALWKSMAEQVSDPKLTTLDVKPLGPLRGARDRHLQSQDQGADAAGRHRQISRGMGENRKRLEARGRYLERREIGRLRLVVGPTSPL